MGDKSQFILSKREKLKMKFYLLGVSSAFVVQSDCPDQDLNEICEGNCTNKFTACLNACGSDSSCTSTCNRDFFTCSDACPCNPNCPNGCDGSCQHPLCTGITTTLPTTTTEPSDDDNLNVLILNNYVANNFPKMVNFKGEEQNDLYFVQGRDTDIQYGCSTKFRGEFWTFGGRGAPYKNQANKIVGCEIVRQRDLPFDFIMGACNTFQLPSETKDSVFMCFGSSGYNQCRKWDGMSYEKQPNAIHFHYDTRLSILDGEPFALGHMTANPHGNKAEVFNFDENQWKEIPEYPWESCIFYYATVSLQDSVIVFGGWNGRSDLSTVAEVSATDASWSKLGDLQQPRHGHSAITNGKTVLVIGGSGKFDTEKYILGEIEDSEDFEWSSSIEAPLLDTYSVWP